ncbi:MAG: mRNA surveillance protein pelota [Methanomassiliicoccales archaeon]
MKILHQDKKNGVVKLQIDSTDDLWHLYNIIQPGDRIIGTTFRREEMKSDKLRSERGEKKRMTLKIIVEKMEFHETESRLRVLGTISEGPQDLGSYHTFNLEEGDTITIIKDEWPRSALERLQRAVEDTTRPQLLFVVIDYDEAFIAMLAQFGIKEIAKLYKQSGGKMYAQEETEDFYGEVIEKIRQVHSGDMPLVILGPGFAKEALLAEGKRRAPDIFSKAFLFHTGQSGLQGIHEIMKKGLGSEVLKDSRVAEETKLVEEVLMEIARDGKVAYGPKQVEEAVLAGAVRVLLILDSILREKKVEVLISKVEQSKGTVVIVSDRHEAGKKLEALGGMAALLRYKLN